MITFEIYEEEHDRTYHQGRIQGHVLGLCGEAGEVADMVKKDIYHKVSYHREDIIRELGDVLWYLAALCKDHDTSLKEVAQRNIDKLKARYPDGFVPGGGIRSAYPQGPND